MGSCARVVVVCSLVALTACTTGTGDFDEGTADITVEREGEEPLRLVHDPELSQVTLTPPTEGTVELDFTYQDPLVTLRLVVNTEVVDEGEEVALPVTAPRTADDLLLTLEIDDALFTSDDPGAAGSVLFDVLFVDEEAGAADVIATIEATLVGAGATVSVSGHVEARVGELDDL